MDAMRSNEPVDIDLARLKQVRTAANLTGAEVARRASLDRHNFYGIEAGRRRVSFETLLAIADALNVTDPITLTPPGPITLQKIRLRRRLTRNQLADKANVSYHLIYKIESGERRITPTLVQQLASILLVTPDEINAAVSANASQ